MLCRLTKRKHNSFYLSNEGQLLLLLLPPSVELRLCGCTPPPSSSLSAENLARVVTRTFDHKNPIKLSLNPREHVGHIRTTGFVGQRCHLHKRSLPKSNRTNFLDERRNGFNVLEVSPVACFKIAFEINLDPTRYSHSNTVQARHKLRVSPIYGHVQKRMETEIITVGEKRDQTISDH